VSCGRSMKTTLRSVEVGRMLKEAERERTLAGVAASAKCLRL
jgi:hypothetical protein